MTRPVLLDAGPLGRIAHPRARLEVVVWLESLLRTKVPVIVPEIADYEVRRSLLLHDLTKSLQRLDQMRENLIFLPLNPGVMLRAAELWAQTRKQGHPTADPKDLDGDVILAAQAEQVAGLLATDNVGHLARLADAVYWAEITA